MFGKRAAFWGAVAGVSILSHVALEIAADKLPFLGLSRLVAYIHRGPTGGAQ
ncbi:hypothetical protein C5N14_30815 [Micromonospora sp. MW-13]|nr:hypothetical protein C5N14_30815 [Micromonospora sp. MW-13]